MSESFTEAVIEQMAETHQSTNNSSAQVSDDSHDKGAPTQPDNWQGDTRYFQTGKKAGQLKPSAASKSKEFAGLDLGSLKATDTVNGNTDSVQTAVDPKAEKAKAKAERKSSDARVGAKIAMRILNTLVKWISGNEYGKDFTPQQTKERNAYAEELENDWREYLLTLDIPLHPALIVAFGSVTYVADAFATEKGKERAASLKEKVFGKIGMAMFSRGAK